MFGKSKETMPSPGQQSEKEEMEAKLSEVIAKFQALSDERVELVPELQKLEKEAANKRTHIQNLNEDIRFLIDEKNRLERKLGKINK